MNSKPCTVGYCIFVIVVSLAVSACHNPESDFKKAEQANTEQAYSEFIKKHPESPLVTQAQGHIEHNAYDEVQKSPSIPGYERFLQRFPGGGLTSKVKSQLEALQFAQAENVATVSNWDDFLKKYPRSTNAATARTKLCQLEFDAAVKANDIASFESFLKKYPASTNAATAGTKLCQLEFDAAVKANDIASFESFLKKYPSCQLSGDISNRLNVQLDERDWNQTLLSNTAQAYLGYSTAHSNSTRIQIVQGTLNALIGFGMTVNGPGSPTLLLEVDDGKKVSEFISRRTRSNTRWWITSLMVESVGSS